MYTRVYHFFISAAKSKPKFRLLKLKNFYEQQTLFFPWKPTLLLIFVTKTQLKIVFLILQLNWKSYLRLYMAENRTKTDVHGLKSLNMGVHVHCTQILEGFSVNMYICTSVKMVIYV